MMSRVERWLRKWVPFKEIGWADIGEEFTRFQLIKTPFFNLYLHRLVCETWHAQCHDHPWWFITLILKGGYVEKHHGNYLTSRKPGTILYRPAKFVHSVVTWGEVCWSLVLTGPKTREWGFNDCVE